MSMTAAIATDGGRSRRPDPADWTLQQGVDKYLARRRADGSATDRSIRSWKYDLKLFIEWLQEAGVESVGQIKPYDLSEYYDYRAADVKPTTLYNEMNVLLMFFRFLQSVGVATEEHLNAIQIPDVDLEERTRETSLRPDEAIELVWAYRQDPSIYANREHAFLELAWFTGARLGGLRSLDLRDFYVQDRFVEFHHRPDTDTPLKNKRKGERPVGLPSETVNVVRRYIEHHRHDIQDEYDRQPLLASRVGRPTENTVRSWCYRATVDCVHGYCPHDNDPDDCEYLYYSKSSQCPGSIRPHDVRSTSITYQLNKGFPPALVAERVDATVDTIEKHYDWASAEERWRRDRDRMEQRRSFVADLDLEGEQ